MSDVIKHFFETMPIKHVWLFLTEQCQLACDYCFFQDRDAQQTLSPEAIETLLKQLPSDKTHDIVFSGGEPLLVWDLFVKSVQYIKRFLPKSIITLQSNCLLLDEEKCIFLKNNNIAVEPGIDGLLQSHLRHRQSTLQDSYQRLLTSVELLKKHQIIMNPTMTVHPEEVSQMEENFRSLLAYGLKNIEIHPAFLAPWEAKQKQVFLEQYRLILIEDVKNQCHYIGKDYSAFAPMSIDLILIPTGEVFPNWTYLTFAAQQRNLFVLMHLSENKLTLLTGNTQQCLVDLQSFFLQPRTYRDMSCFHAERVLRLFSDKKQYQEYTVYKELCEQIQQLDQKTGIRLPSH